MKYKFDYMLPHVIEVAQQELKEFLDDSSPTMFADLTWFEAQYGHELDEREIMKLWYAVPNLRAGKETNSDVVITEIGGTVGDIESLPFLEAILFNLKVPSFGIIIVLSLFKTSSLTTSVKALMTVTKSLRSKEVFSSNFSMRALEVTAYNKYSRNSLLSVVLFCIEI
jgi:hypothetical protein